MQRHTPTLLLLLAAIASTGCSRKPEPTEVTIALKDAPGSLSAATVLVDYSQAGAKPFHTNGQPACATIVPDMTADFSDDGQGAITIHATAPGGFSAPIDMAVCRMVPDAPDITGQTIASRLRVSLLTGTDRAGKPVEHRVARAGGLDRSAGATGEGAAPPAQGEAEGEAAQEHERGAREHGRGAEQRNAAADRGAEERLAAARPATPEGQELPGGAPGTEPGQKNSLIPESHRRSAAAAPPEVPGGGGDQGGSDRGTGDRGGSKADSNDDSDTDREAVPYTVTIGVTNAVGPLGALQFNIQHHGTGGGFAGASASARCNSEVPAALSSFNDVGRGTLRGALIDLDGISTPGAVVTCTFKSRNSVSRGDFSVEVVDATNVEGKPPTASVQMAVTDLRAP